MTSFQKYIGFMQGRLSNLLNGRIQSFPVENWEKEFQIAGENQISRLEWTIDTLTYSKNPLVNTDEINKINYISRVNGVVIPSVTCDYYMENPHWNPNGEDIEREITRIIESMPRVGATILVIPLVDNSSISMNQGMDLEFFANLRNSLKRNNVRIAFELDLDPASSRNFIDHFEANYFGINFDMGNSASLGFSPEAEFSNYGHRIINIHVKDRILGGHTVPLGCGNVEFKDVVEQIKKINYQGNFIMQTARATDEKHTEELIRNIDFFKRVLHEY